ncbi:MAG TPA: hypothetical protein VER03_19310 [Bryobacteraceae bacterium]|nr:hypothetical protein [Bryobacteraceae bacterium]
MHSRRGACLFAPLLLLLASCSEPPKKAKEPEKPAEPVGAQYAFHQVFLTARTWAQDILVMRVRDVPMSGLKGEGGKRAAWEVTVVSPSKGKSRTYMYSVVEEGNIHKGVFAGLEEDYRGPRGQVSPWPVQAFKVDSVKAYEVAAEKSADFMKQNPDIPITFLLEQTSRHSYLTWRVIWGTSVATSGYSVYVNAATGEYVEKMR